MDYRILCLGESTTQNQWPILLGDMLNQNDRGLQFKIIDKGRIGTSSMQILSRLEGYLNEYEPDMVVVMMGINDGEWVWTNPTTYEDTGRVRTIMFMKNLRLNKIANYIVEGLRNRYGDAALSEEGVDGVISSSMTPARGEDLKRVLRELNEIVAEGSQGELNHAVKSCMEKILTAPFRAESYYDLGNTYFYMKEYDKAEQVYRAGIRIAPQDQQGYIKMGRMYQHKGEYDKAEKAYRQGIRAVPQSTPAYMRLGKMYVEMGEYNKAEKVFRLIVRRTPRDIEGYVELARLYMQMGRRDRAEKMFKEGLGIDPHNEQIYREMMKYYCRYGDYNKAIELGEARIRENPQDAQRYCVLGGIYRDSGDYEKAEKTFRAALEVAPENDHIYTEMAITYTETHQYAQAQKMYETVIKQNPDDEQAYINLIDLYNRIGTPEKGNRLYERIVKTTTNKFRHCVELGKIYRDQGLYDKAHKMYEMGIQSRPQNPEGYIEMSYLYVIQGRQREAEEVLNQGIERAGYTPNLQGALDNIHIMTRNEKRINRRRAYLRLPTIRNYQKLRNIVLGRGAKLVCMQYPLRDIVPLKEVLGERKGILYVENRENFEEALKDHKYSDLFVDAFAGDFGHCTALGYQIIAAAVRDVVAREVFADNKR